MEFAEISVPTWVQLKRILADLDSALGHIAASGSPSTAYRLALENGHITQAQHDAARREYPGTSWFYAGD
jgi:hypothetical protein